MKFSLGCELGYDIADAATLIFNVEPVDGGGQRILTERFTLDPDMRAEPHEARDTGNRYRRISAPKGHFTLRCEAEVELSAREDDPDAIPQVPVAELPLETLTYLNPSRYCPSDQLARFAERQFSRVEPGHNRVTEICNWIRSEVDYVPGTSDSATTAADTFATRAGVCRDFAHLGITFCRALGIPARFVSCYAWQLVPQDFHAVFEAYLGDRWYLFDPTRMAALNGLVRIGSGRDAADTAFSTIFGAFTPHPMKIWIEAQDAPQRTDWTTEAVSVAAD